MIASLRSRIDGWFLSRRPPSDTLELTQRNVYIVPTRAGWTLGATLLVLLIASINYQLNLGYLLTFLLAGSVAVGMPAVYPVHFEEARLKKALLANRNYVAPDDVQSILPQTIAHRLTPVGDAGRGAVEQVRAMIADVPLP